jgi:hypothetical protein
MKLQYQTLCYLYLSLLFIILSFSSLKAQSSDSSQDQNNNVADNTNLFVHFDPSTTLEKTLQDDAYYAFIVVDGVWKDNIGYASQILHYPGYSTCNSYRDLDFFHDAKRSFSSHLQAYYNRAFPYGENNNFFVISNPLHSTYDLLKTRAQAEQRLTDWIADQKSKGYQVRLTRFSFSCSNLP